jgi:hypothetical protein
MDEEGEGELGIRVCWTEDAENVKVLADFWVCA